MIDLIVWKKCRQNPPRGRFWQKNGTILVMDQTIDMVLTRLCPHFFDRHSLSSTDSHRKRAFAVNILIIEDNHDIAANIADFLEPAGHCLDFAVDGREGLALAADGAFDVIVLDLMLPGGMDGIQVCRRLRQDLHLTTPVLMLTARDQLDDKLAGFDAGTDDYLVKPFSVRELEARLVALARRREEVTGHRLIVGDLVLDTDTLQAERQGHRLDINPIQRKLLTHLMKQSHRVVRRAELEQLIWGESPPDTDILRTHIYALRRIIDRPFEKPLLHTVHGIGYRLSDRVGEEN